MHADECPMGTRRLVQLGSGAIFLVLALTDLGFGLWRGAIFFSVCGGVLLIQGGALDKVLPVRAQALVHPKTKRDALFHTIGFGYLGIVIAFVFVLFSDPAPAGLILIFASLILAVAYRELRRL